MRQRELEKERDRAADLLRERQRQVHADNEAADSDEEEEPWRRKPYSGTRRALERQRRRVLEHQDDEADRQTEREQAAAAAAAEAEAAAAQLATAAEQPEVDQGAAFGADDSIMAAMLAAVKVKPESMAAVAPAVQPAAAVMAPAVKRKVRAAFVEDEEEEKLQRKLIPIRCVPARNAGLDDGSPSAAPCQHITLPVPQVL